MVDDRDPPIEEMNYLSGLTVVDIGDYRVSRGKTRRERSGCNHASVSYDPSERRIWCRDCERDVDPFDAFCLLAENYSSVVDSLDARMERVKEAEGFVLRSIAAKKVDQAWRSRNSVPACPHCHQGLFPEHFKNGMTTLGIDYARARLKKKDPSP